MKGNIFYERFQTRKSKELEAMLKYESLYQPEALDAAKYILAERAGVIIPEAKIDIPSSAETPPDDLSKLKDPFQTYFFKTLSRREFYSAFSLACLLVAIISTLNFYGDEDWLEDKWYSHFLIYFFLLTPLLHVWYKKEHKRSNDFIGRFIHILLFLVFAFTIRILQVWLVQMEIHAPFSSDELHFYFLFPFALAVIAMMLEVPYTIFRYFLKVFRWQIW